MLVKRWTLYGSDETEIRLPFHRSFSSFWNIFRDLCNQVFYSWAWVRKRLLRDINLNQKQIAISKWYLVRLQAQ